MTSKTAVPESAEGGSQVLKDVVYSRVEPSSISEHPEFLYPSVYDMAVIDIYMPTVCLYRLDPADPSAFWNFVHGVRTSLSLVLSLYYPMAGNWIVTEDAWTRKLVCNDKGAVFVEAAIDEEMDQVFDRNDLKFPEELTGDHAVPGFDARAVNQTPSSNEFPSLIVQVTRFRCGGVALTLNFNHMTVDGYGFNRFLKAWSEIASTGQMSSNSKPIFDRAMAVSHLDKSDILGIRPDMKNLEDSLPEVFRSIGGTLSAPVASARKLFSVRKEVVEKLKDRAEAESSPVDMLEFERPQRFSTFECITAQLWRCFARVPKDRISHGQDKVPLFFPVEIRRKCSNPCLTEDFSGNMLLLVGPPELPGSEVRDKPFSFSASHIHKAVTSLNHNTFGELLDCWLKRLVEVLSTAAAEKPERNIFNNQSSSFQAPVMISAWSRFDNFYNLDFGYGGPFYFFPCAVWELPSTAAIIFLLPPAPSTRNVVAIEMIVRAPTESFNLLQEDPEFINLVS